jgi:hypothetical protein
MWRRPTFRPRAERAAKPEAGDVRVLRLCGELWCQVAGLAEPPGRYRELGSSRAANPLGLPHAAGCWVRFPDRSLGRSADGGLTREVPPSTRRINGAPSRLFQQLLRRRDPLVIKPLRWRESLKVPAGSRWSGFPHRGGRRAADRCSASRSPAVPGRSPGACRLSLRAWAHAHRLS